MSDKIKTIREALEFGDHVTYADNHFAVVLNAQPEFDQYEVAYRQYDGGGHEYWKTAVCHLSELSALDQLTPTAEKAGDAMAVQLRHLAEEYRKTMSMRGGSSDIHPSHADALTAWFAAKAHPPLDIPEAIKAFEFIKEIGDRSVDLTRERDMHQMVKWANHGISSLTHQPK